MLNSSLPWQISWIERFFFLTVSSLSSLIKFRPTWRLYMLTEGSKAPAFTLPDDHGHEVSLSDYTGKKTVVLFFFPKADTPG
jgi:cytochrome oxidase Cu insertion factor (SCO1/SenC/PrrC family)